MACTCPVEIWPAPPGAATKRPVYSPQRSYQGAKSDLRPCGHCTSCRLEYSQGWATRIDHETKSHEHNYFVTITYDNDHLPAGGSLKPEDVTKYLKRLRRHLGRLRYVLTGEYGEQTLRPHYHAITFGLELPDLKLADYVSQSGEPQWTSETADRIWGKGKVIFGTVTPKSAAYVARYAMKKQTGERKKEAYRRLDPETGEIYGVLPEFIRQSRNPGIGMTWFDKFKTDCVPSDFLIRDGKRIRVPRGYIEKLPEHEKAAIKSKRRQHAKTEQAKADNTERRLMTKHESAKLRAARLKREL